MIQMGMEANGNEGNKSPSQHHYATRKAVAIAAVAAAGISAAMWRLPAKAELPRALAHEEKSQEESLHPESTSLSP